MRILILGGDGYLGWATAMYLSAKGHHVTAVDNYLRRTACLEMNVEPLMAVPTFETRSSLWHANSDYQVQTLVGDVCDARVLRALVQEFQPEGVVHYAEQPSAPYSMAGFERAARTVQNNLMSTLTLTYAVKDLAPGCHIVKLGTMGEYGTPNIDIEEGYLDVTHKGRSQRFLYPKTPGSIYHLSKVNDSDLLYFATRTWGLAVTDLNQGPVYGIETDELQADERLSPIFNYDHIFGTVINRFIVQAVAGFPLTVYGKGGQTRGFINIRDTLRCVELALLRPAASGEFRVFNQFTEAYSVLGLAEKVANVARGMGFKKVSVQSIENPRKEKEEHYYHAAHSGLRDLGLIPNLLTDSVIEGMLRFAIRYRDRINTDYILPRVKWV